MEQNKAIKQLLVRFGDRVKGLVIYPRWIERIAPDDQQEEDYLLLVEDQLSWLEIRTLYRSFAEWEIVPLILPCSIWEQIVQLNPAWGYHVAISGRHWFGKIDLWGWRRPVRRERLAPISTIMIEASSLLMGHLLEDEKKEKATARLRQLYQLLCGKKTGTDHWRKELAEMEALLISRIADLNLTISETKAAEDAPLLLPELVSICQQGIELLLVLEEKQLPTLLGTVDWKEVGDLLAADYEGVGVTTAGALSLSLMEDRAATVILRGYQQQWGADILAGNKPERATILQDAARLAVGIIPALSRDYLTYSEDKMGMLIHDYQNNLLNVQLEHELLHRLLKIPRAEVAPLPGKEESVGVRVGAIFEQAAWWGEYYMALVDEGTN